MQAPSLNWHLEGKDCGFWLDQADCFSQSVHAGMAILAALATITLIGSLIVLAAQEGCCMGELNNLVKYIDPHWVYATVALSAATLLLDIVAMFALTNGYTNLVYSEKELNAMKFLPRDTIAPALQPKQYLIYTTPKEAEKPVFAVFTHKTIEPHAVAPFKTEEAMLAHVEWLNSLGYLLGEEKGHWENKEKVLYSQKDMQGLVNAKFIQVKIAQMRRELLPGFFDYEPVHIADWNESAYLFVGLPKEGENLEVFFTRLSEEPKHVGAQYLPDYYNLQIVRNVVEMRKSTNSPKPLGTHQYINYDQDFSHCVYKKDDHENPYQYETTKIYITTYRLRDVNTKTEYFLVEKDRTSRLEELNILVPNKN